MKAAITVWLDLSLAVKLNEAVVLKQSTQSAVVVRALQHFLDEHMADAVFPRKQTTFGNRSDKDGMDAPGIALIEANLDLSVRKLQSVLTSAGIKRSTGWICERKWKITNPVVKIS